MCTEFSLDDDIEANDNTNHLGGRREECGDDDAEDDVDDEDNKHLGGHREECGDTKRHSSRDRVLVEPETDLGLEMSNCRIFDKHVHDQSNHENSFSNLRISGIIEFLKTTTTEETKWRVLGLT